jgi:hypothetical protein
MFKSRVNDDAIIGLALTSNNSYETLSLTPFLSQMIKQLGCKVLNIMQPEMVIMVHFRMDCWIINKSGQSEILEKLLNGTMSWRVELENRKGQLIDPKNLSSLGKGDRVLIYFSYTPGHGAFYGTGIFVNKRRDNDGYLLKFHKKSRREGFDRFESPIEFKSIKDELEWKPTQGSIHRVSEDDFDTILSKSDKEFARQKAKLERQSQQTEPRKTEPARLTVSMRKARSATFRMTVRKDYHYSCALCGKKRSTRYGNPEVEAAHIYPLERDGSNDFRNGIALCKLHHWAFENGLFSIRDDYSIVIEKRIKNDRNYIEISRFVDKKMKPPERHLPHPKFLREHRQIHGFRA